VRLYAENCAIRPRFFESYGRPLYGLYCEASGSLQKPAGVVICHSFGPEQAVGSHVLAMAARQAALIGFSAVAYHSRGHGDSAGDFADVTFESMVQDALCAADQVTARSGATQIIWLGLRFGTLVAAAAAARCSSTSAVALWEPVHTGEDYFLDLVRGLLFSEVARGKRSGVTAKQLLEQITMEEHVDIHASYIHRKFHTDAQKLRLADLLAGWRGATLIAQIQPRMKLSPKNHALQSELEQRGANVSTMMIREEPGWQFPMWRQPWTSPDLIARTTAWLDAVA